MELADVVATSDAVAGSSARLAKIARLAELLRRLRPEEVPIVIAWLTGVPLQGKIGIGASQIARSSVPPAPEPGLDVHAVDAALAEIAAATGKGSLERRVGLLRDLLARATAREQDFLVRLLFGELRQGALEGVLVEAVARAAGLPADAVRRATMLAGDLGTVATRVLTQGAAGLADFALEPLQPVAPMLADSAESVSEALGRLGRCALEWKLDGARVQLHRDGDQVRVYSRNLRDVTTAVPEVVSLVRSLPLRRVVLDGEVIALRPDGTPLPFQETMRRFGRRLDVDRMREEIPLTPVFFDCLLRDDVPLIDRPQLERFGALEAVVPTEAVVPHLVTADIDAGQAFLETALARGHEGLVAKGLASPYAAGRRGQAWLKIKQARTLDLVIVAAEWGHGRRQGWLSNLHLGARDAERGGFVMLGKTFKGLTDEMLAWQTARLLELESRRDRHTVYVRPELVVEIAFSDLQASPHYPGGLALRFARVKGYRPDKSAAEADTLATVQDIYRRTTGHEPPTAAGMGRG